MARRVYFDGVPEVHLQVGAPSKLVIPGHALCGKNHRTDTPERALALSIAKANGLKLMPGLARDVNGTWVANYSMKWPGFDRRLAAEVRFMVARDVGVAGDECGPGNECGRIGCPNCQQ